MTKPATERSHGRKTRSIGSAAKNLPANARAEEFAIRTRARFSDVLRGAASLQAGDAIDRHLVMVHQPGWQAFEDWSLIAAHVRDIEPGIAPIIVRRDLIHSYMRRQAARHPSLVF